MIDIETRRKKLLSENASILCTFEGKGIDLSRVRDIEFRVALPDKKTCIAVRKKIREALTIPIGSVLLVVQEEGTYSLVLAAPIKPTASEITEIELDMLGITTGFGSKSVTWELRE